MKIEFNYNDIQFVVDPAQHQILIDGQIADGIYAPVGGIVVDVDVEDPEICKVITDADNSAVEKIIVYGAPLKIGDKVIILDQYVIPADIFIRNDIEADYKYFSEMLQQKAEAYISVCQKYADNISGYFGGELAALTHKLVGDATAKMDGLIDEWGGNQ
jgi:hypothetical protein